MCPDVLQTRWASLRPSLLPSARGRQSSVPAGEGRAGVTRTLSEAESVRKGQCLRKHSGQRGYGGRGRRKEEKGREEEKARAHSLNTFIPGFVL